MRRIRLSSPAKLNLFLKVLDKRPDGFHNISTVFERIDLSDEILLKLNPSGAFASIASIPRCPAAPKTLSIKRQNCCATIFGSRKVWIFI